MAMREGFFFLPVYFAVRNLYWQGYLPFRQRKAHHGGLSPDTPAKKEITMITKENIHTLGDLLETAALDYENQVFIRYEKDGIVYEKGYRTFAMDTRAVSHWTMNRCGELGKRLHAALIGKCS